MNHFFTKALFLTCVCLTHSQAQDQVRTDLMPIGLGADITLHYLNKGVPASMDLLQSGMGTPRFYKGPKTVAFYAKAEDLAKIGKADAVPPVAQVILPDAGRVLLLALTNAEKQRKLVAYPVKDSELSEGEYRIYNFSHLRVACLLGRKSSDLAPGTSYDVKDDALHGKDGDVGAQFAWIDDKKQKHLVYSTIWGHAAKARSYVFLMDTGNPQQPLDVRKFHDVPSVPSQGFEKEQK